MKNPAKRKAVGRGLPVPKAPGLLSLPWHVQGVILSKLPMLDVIGVSEVCKELYLVSGLNEVWKPRPKEWSADKCFELLLKLRNRDQLDPLDVSNWAEQRTNFQQSIAQTDFLSGEAEGLAKHLILCLLSQDLTFYTAVAWRKTSPDQLQDYVTFSFELALRLARLWEEVRRTGKCAVNDRLNGLAFPNAPTKEYYHIFFKSLRMVCYWACGDMVLDMLHKAERDADLDIWEDAQEKWMRFERFLWLLRYMPFSKKPLWLWIVDINNDKHAAMKLPDLHDLGQVAFRSQVLLNVRLSKELIKRLNAGGYVFRCRKQGCLISTVVLKRILVNSFAAKDYPASRTKSHTLRKFLQAYDLHMDPEELETLGLHAGLRALF